MGVASRFNRGKKFKFEIPENFEYRSLHDLFNDNGEDFVYKINAIYINKKSKFGESPVIATNNELVNLPKHLTDLAKEIIADKEAVEQINNGEFGFTIYTYETSNRKELCYSVNFVDC